MLDMSITYNLGYEVYGGVTTCCSDFISTKLIAISEGVNLSCDCGTSFKSVQIDKSLVTRTSVQSLIFSKKEFPNRMDAAKLTVEERFKASDLEETDDSWRFVQSPIGNFDRSSITIVTIKAGVRAIIGEPMEKAEESEETMEKTPEDTEKSLNRAEFIEKATDITHSGITKEADGHTHSFTYFVTIGPDGQNVYEPFGWTGATSSGNEHSHSVQNTESTEETDGHSHAISIPVKIVVQTNSDANKAIDSSKLDIGDMTEEEAAELLQDLFSRARGVGESQK